MENSAVVIAICAILLYYRIGCFIGDLIGGRLAKNLKFCFVAGTLVQTRDGTKPIEEIKKGDEVLSYNEQTGENEYQKVLQTFTRYAQDVLSIRIVGESEPIGVTGGHPFFVRVQGARSGTSRESDSEGEWRRAGELQVGDVIRTASGDWAKVEAVKERGNEQVYNFEVERNHNYFVGGQGFLVHNGCREDNYPSRTRKGTKERLENGATGPDGQIRCQNCGTDLQSGQGTAEHIPPLVETHNNTGYNTDQATRNNLFNDTAKELHCIGCQKSQGGSTTQRYRTDTGPNYVPRRRN